MTFKEKFQSYKDRILPLVDTMRDATEEATKNAFIMPFISLLGYDVFNPHEVIPEFTADVGTKKGEKVDYAVLKDGEPIILVEAKRLNVKLQKAQHNQLYRYFSTTHSRIAILTNGVECKIYSDLNTPNIMDDEPFLSFNLITDDIELYIHSLEKLTKENFNIKTITENAIYLKYAKVVEKTFLEDLQSPSDELVKYFLSRPDIKPSGKITQKMIDNHRDVTKETLQRLMGAVIQTTTTTATSVVTQQTTLIPLNKFEESYPLIVNTLKANFSNISIDYSEKNDTLCLLIYNSSGLKLSRVRAYQRESNKFDVAIYRQDGTTARMLFFNNQDELDGILKSFKEEVLV